MTSCVNTNSLGSSFNQFKVSPRGVPVKADLPENKSEYGKNNKRDILGNVTGIVLGLAVPVYMVYDNLKKITPDAAAECASDMNDLLPDVQTFEDTKITADKILEDSGLKRKGVSLHFIDNTEEGAKELHTVLDEVAPQKTSFNKRLKENLYSQLKEGANAVYIHGKNKKPIIVHSERLYSNVYHELGHAMNFNGNIISKLLVKTRNLMPFGASIVAPVAVLTSILHKPDKTKQQKDKNFIEKTVDFVSKHPVVTTALGVFPVVAEEAAASIRGLNAASKHLPIETVGKLAQNYFSAWATYGTVAGGTILGVYAGVKASELINNRKVS